MSITFEQSEALKREVWRVVFKALEQDPNLHEMMFKDAKEIANETANSFQRSLETRVSVFILSQIPLSEG